VAGIMRENERELTGAWNQLFFWRTINVKENPEFGKGRQQIPSFICPRQGKHTGK
jgi:hypothetical protein